MAVGITEPDTLAKETTEKTETPAEEKASLYIRLGGYDSVSVFAAHVLKRCMENEVIGHFWNTMSESTFHKEHINFVDFLCKQWGGNTVYRGRDMITAHRGMGITEEHWVATFEVIERCYEEFNLAPELRVEVHAFLQSYHDVIVGSPSFRSVVLKNPDMDVTKGMAAYGEIWPPRRSAAKKTAK